MLRRTAPACLGLLSLQLAATATSDAQTWRWNSVTHTPNTPPLAAQSTVALSGGQLRMTYTVPLQNRQVVIESCHAAITDVGYASTVVTAGRTYLLIQLKPARAAACASGDRPAVALPTDNSRDVAHVAQAINRLCCANVGPAASPKPVAQAVPGPKPSALAPPAPAPSATPQVTPPSAADWVESQGIFAFVRVRNVSAKALSIRGAEVFDCGNVRLGCGPASRAFALEPGRTQTIATVTSADGAAVPAFRYRYTAAVGSHTSERSGSSAKTLPQHVARMSALEIRTAQADALGLLRPPAAAAPSTFSPARLVKRGSSELAIGQTGTALVRLTIAANGTPEEATIVSITNRRLSAAAIETAVSSTYAPALQNGKAVSAKYVATFSFDGADPATASIPMWKRSPLPAASTAPVSEPIAAPVASPPPTPPPVSPASPLPSPSPL